MGRPKCYASPAARQAAYRERLTAEMVLVNRHALAQWEARLTRLHDAIAAAALAGDPLARQVAHPQHDATLDALIAGFAQRAQAGERPTADDAAPAHAVLGLRTPTDPPARG
jgi:hypothetical protein